MTGTETGHTAPPNLGQNASSNSSFYSENPRSLPQKDTVDMLKTNGNFLNYLVEGLEHFTKNHEKSALIHSKVNTTNINNIQKAVN